MTTSIAINDDDLQSIKDLVRHNKVGKAVISSCLETADINNSVNKLKALGSYFNNAGYSRTLYSSGIIASNRPVLRITNDNRVSVMANPTADCTVWDKYFMVSAIGDYRGSFPPALIGINDPFADFVNVQTVKINPADLAIPENHKPLGTGTDLQTPSLAHTMEVKVPPWLQTDWPIAVFVLDNPKIGEALRRMSILLPTNSQRADAGVLFHFLLAAWQPKANDATASALLPTKPYYELSADALDPTQHGHYEEYLTTIGPKVTAPPMPAPSNAPTDLSLLLQAQASSSRDETRRANAPPTVVAQWRNLLQSVTIVPAHGHAPAHNIYAIPPEIISFPDLRPYMNTQVQQMYDCKAKRDVSTHQKDLMTAAGKHGSGSRTPKYLALAKTVRDALDFGLLVPFHTELTEGTAKEGATMITVQPVTESVQHTVNIAQDHFEEPGAQVNVQDLSNSKKPPLKLCADRSAYLDMLECFLGMTVKLTSPQALLASTLQQLLEAELKRDSSNNRGQYQARHWKATNATNTYIRTGDISMLHELVGLVKADQDVSMDALRGDLSPATQRSLGITNPPPSQTPRFPPAFPLPSLPPPPALPQSHPWSGAPYPPLPAPTSPPPNTGGTQGLGGTQGFGNHPPATNHNVWCPDEQKAKWKARTEREQRQFSLTGLAAGLGLQASDLAPPTVRQEAIRQRKPPCGKFCMTGECHQGCMRWHPENISIQPAELTAFQLLSNRLLAQPTPPPRPRRQQQRF